MTGRFAGIRNVTKAMMRQCSSKGLTFKRPAKDIGFLPESADPPQVAKHLSALDILHNHVQVRIVLKVKHVSLTDSSAGKYF